MRIPIDPTVVAKNFAAFANNSSLQESAQLFAQGLPIAEMIQAFAMNPSVLSAFAAFESIYPHGNLERPILEKVILCISLRNQCQFCVASHQDITRGLGISAENADRSESPDHSPRERLALEYAVAIHRNSNQVPDDLFQRLSATSPPPKSSNSPSSPASSTCSTGSTTPFTSATEWNFRTCPCGNGSH